MNNISTCSIFGHREIEITKELEDRLITTFEDLINQGCVYFYFGGFGMFDDLCYKLISKLKEKYPHVQRIFCLYDPRHVKVSKRPNWLKNEEYEDYIYLSLSFDYWYNRIYYRNCAIIDISDFIIFYVENRENSGAYKAFKYANIKKKNYVNLIE